MTTIKLKLRVIGLARSGNHAIIDWLINQHQDARTCFLNNVRHGNYDPFYACGDVVVHNMEGFRNGLLDKSAATLSRLKTMDKDIVIFSYEDMGDKLRNTDSFLGSVYCEEFERESESYFGESVRSLDIIIMRDPYNWLASKLKSAEQKQKTVDVERCIRFWKEIANRALEIENHSEGSSLVVNYNRWAAEEDYRKRLCHQLGGKFSDESLGRVSFWGGGSSFDGMTLDVGRMSRNWKQLLQPRTYQKLNVYLKRLTARPAKMNVLERWKHFEADPRMIRLLEDQDVRLAAQQLKYDVPTVQN